MEVKCRNKNGIAFGITHTEGEVFTARMMDLHICPKSRYGNDVGLSPKASTEKKL